MAPLSKVPPHGHLSALCHAVLALRLLKSSKGDGWKQASLSR